MLSAITDNESLQSMPSTSRAINNNDNISEISVEEFSERVTHTSSLLVASLYSQLSLLRVFRQEIINSIINFNNYVKMLENKYNAIEPNLHKDMSAMFNIVQNAFAHHSSEYQTMNYFKSLNSFVEPQEICVNSFIDFKLMKTRKTLIRNRKICLVPLETILKKFLQLPGVYNKIKCNIQEEGNSEIMTSVFKSKIWHSMKQQYGNEVLPFILYYDELEINNPLGTHRGLHKLGIVYCTIGGINKQFASMLENIFLVQIHNISDYNAVGNKQIFAALINDINKLQSTGICKH